VDRFAKWPDKYENQIVTPPIALLTGAAKQFSFMLRVKSEKKIRAGKL